MLKELKTLDFQIFLVKQLSPCAGDTTLLYVLYISILGKVKILKKILAF